MFKGTNVLITGGTGSWAHELTTQLLEKEPNKIIIFSRGELAQVNMQRKFNDPRLKFIIGDVRDADAVDRMFSAEGIDYTFHMSALKHVPICENLPQEAIKTNVNGTVNLINSAIKYKVKKFIDVSTDKACLDYFQTVALSDGSIKQIHEIVNNREEVFVKSWNGTRIVDRKVTGWHKNKIDGRSLYRIYYQGAPFFGKSQVSLIVTEDHPILTTSGWLEASELVNGDIVYTSEVLLNKKQRAAVLGWVLGDATIIKQNKQYNRAYLRITQCLKQTEWVNLKRKVLSEIANDTFISKSKDKRRQDTVIFSTSSNLHLSELYDSCYSNDGKKYIPRDAVKECLSDEDTVGVFLASLFMDDGCKTGNLIRIATHGFTKEDVEWLSNELNGIGLTSYTYNCKVAGHRTYPELRFRKEGSMRFTEIVSKYIPETMRYKLPDKYINSPYDPSSWDMGDTEYLKAGITIKPHKTVKRDVYCIDVEGTHNFFARGILVHNCSPSNTYGLTKAIGERLTIQANCLNNETSFICVRGGNVLGTNGSVVPYFINQINKDNKITLTDGEMTRYFLTISEAIKLLLQASETGVGGEIYVMKMPSFHMKDVAKAIVDKYGNRDTEIVVIGRRTGEKQHELLVSEYEASRTYTMGEYYIVMPDIDIFRDYSYVNEKVPCSFNGFSSNDCVSDIDRFNKLLEEGGY